MASFLVEKLVWQVYAVRSCDVTEQFHRVGIKRFVAGYEKGEVNVNDCHNYEVSIENWILVSRWDQLQSKVSIVNSATHVLDVIFAQHITRTGFACFVVIAIENFTF